LVLSLGVVLRLTMLTRYDPVTGYDFESHWKYIEWFRTNTALPDIMYSRETHQAPLFYFLAGRILRLGGTVQAVAALSVVAGVLRLGVLAAGLRLFLPTQKIARLFALALAAVLPASVHLDGMVNCEALAGLWAALLILFAALAFRQEGRRRYLFAALAGLFAGLAVLTKISSLAIIGALGVVVAVELAVAAGVPWRKRLALASPFLVALAVAGLVSGWYFAHNRRAYGKAVVSSYDGRDGAALKGYEQVPLLKRRSPLYLLGWTLDIYKAPRWPSGYQPNPFLFPVLVASSFADYYQYHFAPSPRGLERAPHAMPTPTAHRLAQASVVGGTVIALFTVVAWGAVLVWAVRRRRWAELSLLLCPLFGLFGQIWYAWAYPADWEGPVKGVLMQFSALPLYGLFGLAVQWCWSGEKRWRPLAVIATASLLMVAGYTLYARFGSDPPTGSRWSILR
jgi:hypothetical protein